MCGFGAAICENLSPSFKINLTSQLCGEMNLNVVVSPLVLNTCEALVSAEQHFYFNSSIWRLHKPKESQRVEEPKWSICVRTVDTQREAALKLANRKKKKKRICWGHGLFSPEAVIYLGQSPKLNHCVCFYGLGGFVCAPQPLKMVWGTADFSPNLGIVKPHHLLAFEKCLASHFGCWGPVYISSDEACRWV